MYRTVARIWIEAQEAQVYSFDESSTLGWVGDAERYGMRYGTPNTSN